MSKVTLNNISSFQNDSTAVSSYTANNATLTTAFDNTLSRDGTSPNQMGASLDMNSNRILNLPAPAALTEPLRVTDLTNYSPSAVMTSTVVASLPAASSNTGLRMLVTNANATTFASVVAGGGANIVPVYSDGTNWRIG